MALHYIVMVSKNMQCDHDGFMVIRASSYPPLLKDIKIHFYRVEDDDGWIGWIGENKELGIRTCVSLSVFKTWKWLVKRRIRKEILVDMDFIVDLYIVQENRKVTKQFAEIIERWKKMVDPGKRLDKYHWAFDDCGDTEDG